MNTQVLLAVHKCNSHPCLWGYRMGSSR